MFSEDVSAASDIEIFSTCPQSRGSEREAYLASVADVASWSERAGHRGILVYSDNGLVDAWLVAHTVIQATTRLCPLVAVQPVYMHPYSVAKMVTSLAYLHGRRVYLNMLAGGFKNDLAALGDDTAHDERYDRTAEFTLIVKQLLEGAEPVTLEGRYYRVHNLSLAPPLPPELAPGILISGSSEAGLAAARRIGATAIKYPKPPGEEDPGGADDSIRIGARFGVIARESAEEAWQVAYERFPEDRKGQIAHRLAMKVSDSHWHGQLSRVAADAAGGDVAEGGDERNPYWLRPFEQYQTFCPYLVGSYERVGAEVARYLELGFQTFVLDIPPSEEELRQTALVFDHGRRLRRAPVEIQVPECD
jgi:alkanesulfonate monooxygenase